MKQVKVLGSGCSKCVKTSEIIAKVASDLGVEVNVIKETDAEAIMNYGVMSTPAVVVDEQVVHSGSIPAQDAIRGWLS